MDAPKLSNAAEPTSGTNATSGVVLLGAPTPAPYPFAWQNANQLLLLDLAPEGWVMAELVFEPESCRYAEVRRATYDWPREAIGALLSRSLSVSETALIDTTEHLDAYLRRHYGIDLINA